MFLVTDSFFYLKKEHTFSYGGGIVNIYSKLQEDKKPIIVQFIQSTEGKKLLNNYLNDPSYKNRNIIDEAYKYYYVKITTISYFSKVCKFEAMKFDKKLRKQQEKFPLTIDISEENNSLTNKENIIDPRQNTEKMDSYSWDDAIENKRLKNTIKGLSVKQQQLLKCLYMLNLTDTETAKLFKVSQQHISKTKKMVLKKLRSALENG